VPVLDDGSTEGGYVMVSQFASNLADIAQEQRVKFELLDEHDSKLCEQIKNYWKQTVGGFTSCTTVPWSAVFISWCVKQAGATSGEFKFAAAHSVFVHDAINNPRAYEGMDIGVEAVEIGDIIQNNRKTPHKKFNFAKNNPNYESHSMIVVELGVDTAGPFALAIGGNENDAIRRNRISLNQQLRIIQKPPNFFISHLKCRK
jgi:hypothetical protein